MHSALFVAQVPVRERADRDTFLSYIIPKLKNPKDAQRLGENVWLVNFRLSPSALSWLVSSAERAGIVYGILPFADEPLWLPDGFDPNTIRVQNAGS